MFKYLKSFLLVLICAFAFQNNAQPTFGTGFDGKYTITIGDQRMTPDKNVDTYATLKKELANNLHEDYYQVLVQFNDKPNVEMKGEMAGKVITKLAISNNTYIASIAKNMNTRKLKKLNVRAVLALSPEMKISPMVLQLDKEIVKVNIITSNDIKDIVVSDVLEEQHGAKLQLKFRADSVNKYTYSVQKSKLTEIAKLPWILQINEGGMR